ncbi:InlB B-repeat-containing protein, partial [Parabacteroides sp. OttesenSCG-928-N08]|nr:InlB B-repeat-containing protein [Parabacteroides sp. OttesenSCG-928-N08]
MKRNYLFTVVLLLIAMLSPFSAMAQATKYWTDVADTKWYDANQTKFYLSSAEELAGVAVLVNNRTTTFAGCTIYLMEDINLKGKQWVPIGNVESYNSFQGSLFGQGHTIQGLTIDGYYSMQSHVYIGLIGYGSGYVTIKDLTLSEVTIGEVIADFNSTGAFIGEFWGNSLTLTSCHTASGSVIVGEVADCSIAGGLVAIASGDIHISNCSNKLKVIGGKQMTNANSYGIHTSGIVGIIYGYNTSMIQACVNYGEIIGGDAPEFNVYTGGIAGSIYRVTLIDCYNTGNVTGGSDVKFSNYTGGIAGYSEEMSITNCYASGKLNGGNTGSNICTGGIVGYTAVTSISNCLAIQSEISGKGSIHRIAGREYEGLLSNNYSNTLGEWNNKGSDQLDGGVWNDSTSDAPISSWNGNIWDKSNLSLKWESAPISVSPIVLYLVTFDTDGGSHVRSRYVEADDLQSPAAPTKDNYAFSGWYIDSECTTLWDFNDPVTQDMTLYAKWMPTLSSGA